MKKAVYKILIYKDSKGNEPVTEYIRDLSNSKSKDSRIKLKKILEYIKVLQLCGLSAGEPYIKHLDGKIWELRPLRDRILFVSFQNDKFVLLHTFLKKTQKTPKAEIEKAKKEFDYFCMSEDKDYE